MNFNLVTFISILNSQYTRHITILRNNPEENIFIATFITAIDVSLFIYLC